MAGGCHVHFRMLGSISFTQWVPAVSPSCTVTTKHVSRCCQMMWGGGGGCWFHHTPSPGLRTNTVDAGWYPWLVSVPQNYSLNDQASTTVFTSTDSKIARKRSRRIKSSEILSSQINLQNSPKCRWRVACVLLSSGR